MREFDLSYDDYDYSILVREKGGRVWRVYSEVDDFTAAIEMVDILRAHEEAKNA